MLKRAGENRERKTAECAPGTTLSGEACSRGERAKPRQRRGKRAKKNQPKTVGFFEYWWRRRLPNPHYASYEEAFAVTPKVTPAGTVLLIGSPGAARRPQSFDLPI